MSTPASGSSAAIPALPTISRARSSGRIWLLGGFGRQSGHRQHLSVRRRGARAARNRRLRLVCLLHRQTTECGGNARSAASRAANTAVYRDSPVALWTAQEKARRHHQLLFLLGLSVSSEGDMKEVLWGSPAFDAALTKGTRLIGVSGHAFRGRTSSRWGSPPRRKANGSSYSSNPASISAR
jgi:hypothetical protein